MVNKSTRAKDKGKHLFFPWLDIIGITLVSFMFFRVVSLVNPSRYLNVGNDDTSFTTELFMHLENIRQTDETDGYISIVNVGPSTSREEIAHVLKKVYEMNPRQIGVDLYFQKLQNPATDSILKAAADTIKDKTVFVCGIDDGRFLHSFFCNPEYSKYYIKDSDGRVPIKEGASTLLQDSLNKSIQYYQYQYSIGNDTLLSLAAKMFEPKLKETGVSINQDRHVISYKKVRIPVIQYDNLDSAEIADKYVFIGQYGEGQDIHNTPIDILPGIEIHAQILNTMLRGVEIRELPLMWEMLFSVIISLLFCYCLVNLDRRSNKLRAKGNEIAAYFFDEGGLYTVFVTLFTIILLLLMAYIVYEEWHIHIKLTYALTFILSAALFGKSIYKIIIMVLLRLKNKLPLPFIKLLNHSYYFNKAI